MVSPHPLQIAILGTRGVPARYGGFETFAAELSTRLVTRGHRVSVYCRTSLYPDGEPLWQGVERIDLPAVRHKYLETVSHAFLSALHAVWQSYDAVLVCNAANAFVIPLLKAARFPVAINVDGIERKRKKWNALGRLVYRAGEVFSASFADVLVADAEVIAAYYEDEHGRKAQVIAYGSEFRDEPDSAILGRLSLAPRGYVLYVSRFEPENHPLEVIEAYRSVPGSVPLVMVGDAPYSPELIANMKSGADSRVVFTGGVYGADYRTLQRDAGIYVQATEVGGTHPAMIEAMASGGLVLANDTPENREVGGSAVGYFSFDGATTLSSKLEEWLASPDAVEPLREQARLRARTLYGWEAVTDAYEKLFLEMRS